MIHNYTNQSSTSTSQNFNKGVPYSRNGLNNLASGNQINYTSYDNSFAERNSNAAITSQTSNSIPKQSRNGILEFSNKSSLNTNSRNGGVGGAAMTSALLKSH
jgi:hypothetical protein